MSNNIYKTQKCLAQDNKHVSTVKLVKKNVSIIHRELVETKYLFWSLFKSNNISSSVSLAFSACNQSCINFKPSQERQVKVKEASVHVSSYTTDNQNDKIDFIYHKNWKRKSE